MRGMMRGITGDQRCAAVAQAQVSGEALTPELSAHAAGCAVCAGRAGLVAGLEAHGAARRDTARRDTARRDTARQDTALTLEGLERLDRRRRAREVGGAALVALVVALVALVGRGQPRAPEPPEVDILAALEEGFAGLEPSGELAGTELLEPLLDEMQPTAREIPAALEPDVVEGWSL